MGYSAYEAQLTAGVSRFTDHTPDGDTIAHWTFDRDDTDQVGTYNQDGFGSNICYAPIFGFGDDKKNALASNFTPGYEVNSAPGLKGLTEMTVACWFCMNVPPIQSASIIGFRLPGGSGDPNSHNFAWDLMIEGNTGVLKWLWQNGNKLNQEIIGPTLVNNQWYHLMGTRNAAMDTSRLYINGARYAEVTGLLPFNGGGTANDLAFLNNGSSSGQAALLSSTIIQNVEFNDTAAAALYSATLVGAS